MYNSLRKRGEKPSVEIQHRLIQMKVSYLMNSFVFLEVNTKIENGELKVDEVKINSILRYLNNEEKEKVYENIRGLASEIANINLNNKKEENIFKGIMVKQVDVYPVESFNIRVSEKIDASIDEIEKIKSMVFLCCSNISLIINRNAIEIERKIEDIMMNVRKFTSKDDKDKIVDIMVRDDEEAENDLILSISVNKDLLRDEEDDIDSGLISSEVIGIVNELSQYIKEDVVSLLVEDECILRITKKNNILDFKYNKAVLNEIPAEKIDIVKSMCGNLLNILCNK